MESMLTIKRIVRVDRELALMGAEARVRQLQAQIQAIQRQFPELLRGRSLPTKSQLGAGRKKRVFSVKGKRAISAGMRKYWAKRRARGKGTRAAAAS